MPARGCLWGFRPVPGRGISYIDAVKMWPTNAPALDSTIVATLLLPRIGALEHPAR
jgi:hypothetical protein